MTDTEILRFPDATDCPRCGWPLTEGIPEMAALSHPPRKGDICICYECTAVLLVEEPGATRVSHMTPRSFRAKLTAGQMALVFTAVQEIQQVHATIGRPSDRYPHVQRFSRRRAQA